MTDVIVHAGDVRLPLGLPHEPAAAHVRLALDFVTGGRPVGFVPRGLLEGLRLEATDLDASWGAGAGAGGVSAGHVVGGHVVGGHVVGGHVVGGRGIDLLMAACGRTAVLGRLAGPGLPLLTARLPAHHG